MAFKMHRTASVQAVPKRGDSLHPGNRQPEGDLMGPYKIRERMNAD